MSNEGSNKVVRRRAGRVTGVHLRHMPLCENFVRLDVGGQQKMSLLPTRGCRGKLSRRCGPPLGEGNCVPLMEAKPVEIRHPVQTGRQGWGSAQEPPLYRSRLGEGRS